MRDYIAYYLVRLARRLTVWGDIDDALTDAVKLQERMIFRGQS